MTDSPIALGLDPYKDADHPEFLDGVETKAQAAARRREETMDAVRYGAYDDNWLLQQRQADRRMREDRLMLRSRRLKEQHIEQNVAVSDPQAAWIEIAMTADWRVNEEEKWVVGIKTLMVKGMDRCALTEDDTLYDRLEELQQALSEIKRHEIDRKEWQAHAERVAIQLPQAQQEAALRKIEIVRYTLRMHHEDAHEVRRKFEKTIVERGMYHELVDLPYKNISEDLHIYPRQACERYVKVLKNLASLHEARERGETVSDSQLAEAEHAQLEAILSTDSQTAALAADQSQNNWLLTEIRKRLRPDGKELLFESDVEQYEIVFKGEEDDDDDEEEAPQGFGAHKQEMVYSQGKPEPVAKSKPKRLCCC